MIILKQEDFPSFPHSNLPKTANPHLEMFPFWKDIKPSYRALDI